MREFTLVALPMPPSENNAYPTNRQGRRFPSAELKEFKKQMQEWAAFNEPFLAELREAIHGRYLALNLEFNFPKTRIFTKDGRPKKMDASNRIKCLQDSLCEHLSIDDCYIFQTSAKKQVTELSVPYSTAIVSLL